MDVGAIRVGRRGAVRAVDVVLHAARAAFVGSLVRAGRARALVGEPRRVRPPSPGPRSSRMALGRGSNDLWGVVRFRDSQRTPGRGGSLSGKKATDHV